MTPTADTPRPAPRWFRVGVILTLVITLLPLVLGQMVTSIRAGMADPKWPTEPWYLLNNYRLDVGYLVEHSHRIAGFALGGLLSLLTLGLWWTEPRAWARWAGLLGIVALLAGYGEFHRAMMNQPETVTEVVIPPAPVAVTGVALAGVLLIGLSGGVTGARGSGLRTLTVLTLAAVMVQGVLGGTRVRYNALKGPELAAIHGAFAQVVFSLLVALAVLSGRRIAATASRAARWLAAGLVGLLLVQLAWGVLVRHLPTPLAQRMHFLTAFLITAAAVWLIGLVRSDAGSRLRGYGFAVLIGLLVLFQVALGVEAWMGKFGKYVLPELEEKITEQAAAIRTAHVLIGTALLGSAVALTLRLWRPAPRPIKPDHEDRVESRPGRGRSPAALTAATVQPGETT